MKPTLIEDGDYFVTNFNQKAMRMWVDYRILKATNGFILQRDDLTCDGDWFKCTYFKTFAELKIHILRTSAETLEKNLDIYSGKIGILEQEKVSK